MNLYSIKSFQVSSLTKILIKLYKQVQKIPERDYKKGYLTKMSRIGYMVFPYFLKKHQYIKLLEFQKQHFHLSPVIRFLHTKPHLNLPEFENKPFNRFGIHIDSDENSSTPSSSLNWPLINCNNKSTIYWHKLVSGQPKTAYNYTDADHCETRVIDQAVLYNGQPALIRVNRWHSVENNTQKKRVLAAIHFKHYMIWEDAVDYTKKFWGVWDGL